MLEARSVSYTIGQVEILSDVSLSISPGEIVALLGPNGAGKTTLLRLLSGTDAEPTEGELAIDGEALHEQTPGALARRRAILSQEQHLTADFPAFDVVLLGRTPHVTGREQPKDFQIAAGALADARANALADRPYTVLSGGEKQRVALARASAQIWERSDEGNRYLLLDEPTNNLDLAHQHTALRRARRWAADGVGVVTVLHDLNLAAQYADRLVILDHGRVVASGRPRDVLTQELMRDVFQTVARIENHPCFDCPLVVTLEALEEPEHPIDPRNNHQEEIHEQHNDRHHSSRRTLAQTQR
ncbi:MAG: heme ABC transporter ATP-binding protein [Spirochaetales bacterium]